MVLSHWFLMIAALLPPGLLAVAAWRTPRIHHAQEAAAWQPLRRALRVGLPVSLLLALWITWAAPAGTPPEPAAGLRLTPLASWMALLVQCLGLVIAAFSERYLEGDPQGPAGLRRYAAAMSAVLASVQVLLLADHWLLLIAAWAAVGVALERLLCHYGERPFARLAAHKKRLADRAADALLLTAALLAWWETGQPTLSALGPWLAEHSPGPALQLSAVALVLAVILRTALLPVHGWLIQVMEAPTPVSALLHAGVVNLGGVVLIRLAPLLEASTLARGLLLAFGLATTVLAALVMLTRISIKVRLAWSTVAQMGFMVLECGLGLYTMAALHLIGHSLYKAHSFLAASTVVQSTRQQQLVGAGMPALASQLVAPIFTAAVVFGLAAVTDTTWPWWWSAMLALAWAPLLWWPAASSLRAAILTRGVAGLVITAGLTLLALAAHHLPLQLRDAPAHGAGVVAVLGLGLLYAALLTLQHRPALLDSWRRWSYAGFYLDEAYTRWTLRLWPTAWVPTPTRIGFTPPAPTTTSMP